MATTESIAAKGARQARQSSLPKLLDSLILAYVESIAAETIENNAAEIETLAAQIDDEYQLDEMFLEAHRDQDLPLGEVLAQRRKYLSGVKRRHEALTNTDEADIVRRARNTVRQHVDQTMKNLIEATQQPRVHQRNAQNIKKVAFTEPISIKPPGSEAITADAWTSLWRKTVHDALRRNPAVELPLVSQLGTTLVSRSPNGSLKIDRASNANRAISKIKEVLCLTGEDPEKWIIRYRYKEIPTSTKPNGEGPGQQRQLPENPEGNSAASTD